MRKRYIAAVVATAMASVWWPAQAQAQEPVKIGIITDLSGYMADLAGKGSVTAATMAIEDFGGTVLGRPVVLVSANHQNRPDIGASIARRWFSEENVGMITGLALSSVALAVQNLAREKDRIDIVTEATADDLTGRQCSPTGVHWTVDTYALANGTVNAMADAGNAKSWFVIQHDNVFGASLVREATRALDARGLKLVGSVKHPTELTDFSSYVLAAQSSGAAVIALAQVGGDFINTMKQASEFGLTQTGAQLVGFFLSVSDISAIGLPSAQGLRFIEAFYWDKDEATRAWSRRFMERMDGRAPSTPQAAAYGAVTHYLKAVQAAGTTDTGPVMAKMRELPVDDFMTKNGRIREDGRVMRELYLLEVKAPADSKGPWDLMRVVGTIPRDEAFRPLAQSACLLVRK